MRRPVRSRRSKSSAIPSGRSRRRNSPNPSSANVRRHAASAGSRKSSRLGLFVVLLMLAWRLTPLAALTSPHTIREWFTDIAAMPAAPAIVLAVFVVGGLLVFPVTLLIAATAATFGPWLGFAYAAAGAVASAVLTYGVGVLIGRETLENVLGPRLNRIRRAITRHGVLAVATVRMVPMAPFTVVNLAAGASRIPFTDYMLGTILGMLPGLVLMSALGHQIFNVLTAPTPLNVSLFVLAVVAWIAASLGNSGAGDVEPRDARRDRAIRPHAPRDDVEHPRRDRPRPAVLARAHHRDDRPAQSRRGCAAGGRFPPSGRRRALAVRAVARGGRRARHRGEVDQHGRRRLRPDAGEPLSVRCDRGPRHHPCRPRAAPRDRNRRALRDRQAARGRDPFRPEPRRAAHPGQAAGCDRAPARLADGDAGRLQRLVLAGLAARRAQARTARADAARDVSVVVPALAARPHLLLAAAHPQAQLCRSQRGAPPITCR